MTTIRAEGTLLTANADERTLTYRLLPFGEPGRTSLGTVVASRGSVTLPEDASRIVANMEHDRSRPVARATTITEDDDGLTATFRIARTTTGNDLLAEATEGLRTGISVELEDPVIKDGELQSSLLAGAGFTYQPAFPSAQLVASDTVLTDDEGREYIEVDGVRYYARPEPETPPEEEPTEKETEASEPTEGEDETADADAEAGEGDNVNASTAQADPALVASLGNGRRANRHEELRASLQHPQDLFRMLAQAGSTMDRQLHAALSDVTETGAIGNTEPPQWVGELWDGRATERRIVPLFNSAPLTSFKVDGWRWVVKPVVGPYAGNKAAIPSNAATTEPVEIPAERIAGGHDIDRKYVDFGNQGFWQSYLQAMTESYAVQSDAAVLADVLAEATAVVEGAGDAVAGVPEVWIKIVDGVLAVLQATNAMPSSAVVAFDLYRQFLLTPQEGGLEYLNAALGFERGTVNQGNFAVLPHASLAAGNVLVSAREAVTVHELSSTPIRVEVPNVANGGIDVALFGYYATNIHDAGGLALVSGTPA